MFVISVCKTGLFTECLLYPCVRLVYSPNVCYILVQDWSIHRMFVISVCKTDLSLSQVERLPGTLWKEITVDST